MSAMHKVRTYEYVNRPYTAVRDLIRVEAKAMFQRATMSAAARASAVGGTLHATGAGVDVGVDVRIHVRSVRDEEGVAGLSPVTRAKLTWEAVRGTSFFPVMDAELSMWPLTSTETQLEMVGAYQPPLGLVGAAIDVAVGHRLAEATVHRFMQDVVEQLRRELPEST